MGVKKDFYKSQLRRLFPTGRVWSFFSGSNLDKLIDAIAIELERIDDRSVTLLKESDPRQTTELIEEWESMLGLPGPCGDLASTIQERRNQIVAKLTLRGSQTKQFYVDIATSLGYDMTVENIEEYRPFWAGHSVAGDSIANPDPWRHTFTVHPEEFTLRYFRAGQNSCGDRIVVFGDELLECLIEDNKPAHSIVLFRYG